MASRPKSQSLADREGGGSIESWEEDEGVGGSKAFESHSEEVEGTVQQHQDMLRLTDRNICVCIYV